MSEIPFFSIRDVPRERLELWKKEISKVIHSGIFIAGESVFEFEQIWARETGTKFAIGVSNGFDGLTLALESLQLEPGSLVAVPCHTFIATWTSVIRSGLVPIGVDVDHEGLMDLNKFKTVSRSVKAVIPVHMHGSMVDMSKLVEICTETNIRIIEDASQAHFAAHKGQRAGSFGDLGVFSLYPTKNLGALGDAGVVTTNDENLFESIMELRSYGSSKKNKYEHRKIGYNQRLDSIQAAILKVNSNFLDSDNRRRLEIASRYQNEVIWEFFTPLQRVENGRVFHHYCIISEYRDDLRDYLLGRGISTDIHYPNLASTEVSIIVKSDIEKFINGERIAKSTLSLPISPWHTDNQIDYVIKALNQFNPTSKFP